MWQEEKNSYVPHDSAGTGQVALKEAGVTSAAFALFPELMKADPAYILETQGCSHCKA